MKIDLEKNNFFFTHFREKQLKENKKGDLCQKKRIVVKEEGDKI
jgi:hypothetical protein